MCAFCLSAQWSPCSTPSLLPRLRAQTATAGHRIQERDCHHVSKLHLISVLLYSDYWPNAIANFSQCRLSQHDMKRQLTHPEGEEVLKMAFGGEKVCPWSAVPDCKKVFAIVMCMCRGYWWRCVPVAWCTCGPSWAHTPGLCVGEMLSMKCKLSQSLSISCALFYSQYSKPCLRLM